jgi:hypothetical protein
VYNLCYAQQTFKNLVEIPPLNFLYGLGNFGPICLARGQHINTQNRERVSWRIIIIIIYTKTIDLFATPHDILKYRTHLFIVDIFESL